ncbi:MAG: flagellar biosynthesis protein FlaG [Haliea sp.]|uniref:flagellar protein FlaG n=1 Tax=Haliea sp. TaxID=1932666 RepID=UPI000C505BC4|nr:flagellar protein FlaG [Haliea sp.]MBM70513.1 flagellar biosynthesis protein FlaG [Haliea sp.]|tara:strand:+ start:37503 stop:37928 length:426 start_codon:yes stop_codon:yes gene_type:complete
MASSITPSNVNAAPPLPAGNAAAPAQSAVPRQEVAASGKASPPAQDGKATQAKQRDTAQDLAQATRDITDYIQTVNRSLQISVDQELGSTIITVMDKATDEVVRQIPAEEAVALARFLARQQAELGGSELPSKGVFMDQEG